jgi:uncharacterized Fe-S cluster-containing MiaB family protein
MNRVEFVEVPVVEAVRQLLEGKEVGVDWNGFEVLSRDRWFLINVNHFINAKWYVRKVEQQHE